jgi:hypothetical protein
MSADLSNAYGLAYGGTGTRTGWVTSEDPAEYLKIRLSCRAVPECRALAVIHVEFKVWKPLVHNISVATCPGRDCNSRGL